MSPKEIPLKRAVLSGKSLHDAVPLSLAEKEITPKAAHAIFDFYAMLARYRQRLQQAPGELAVMTEQLLTEIDYESEINKQYKTEDMQIMRGEILEQFLDSLRTYVSRAEQPSLGGFLDEISLDDWPDNNKEKRLEQSAVKLMTLHSAKGLEFPRVYMVGMEEGILPHKRSIEADGKAIDEERRLCYVGITRAQDHLALTRCAARSKWGKKRLAVPSRFLREMLGKEGELPK